MFQAIIFDMDGVLIDSEPYWQKGTELFFKKHDLPYSPNISREVMGMGLREITEHFKKTYGLVGNTAKLTNDRRSLVYQELLKNIEPMPGAVELVNLFHSLNYPLGLATSGHSQEKAKEILEKLGLNGLFTVIVSGEDVEKAKPAPDIYLKTAELLKVDPKACLVIEDSSNGVFAAKAANMTVYGVNSDPKLREKLTSANSDKVFSSLMLITPKTW